MNEQSHNNLTPEDEKIAQRLSQVAEQTRANAQFAAELEERLRSARKPRAGWLGPVFSQVSPALRWGALTVILVLVLSWSIKSLIPMPQPATDTTRITPDSSTPTREAPPEETATPVTEDEGYDWRGAKLHLAAPLPDSPPQASVYLLQSNAPLTVEEKIEITRTLAQQFGINGEIYQVPGDHSPGDAAASLDYMVTDGRQRLYVQSENYFTFYADYSANVFLLGNKEISDEEARAVIDSYLTAHGFNFEYQLEKEEGMPGTYYVLPLTPDGHTIRFDYNMPSRLQITIGTDGQVLSLDSSQMDYETVGTYGIRSAQEAFELVLGSANEIQAGVLETSRSGGMLNEEYWERSYPENQTVTLYGRLTSFVSVDPGKPAFTAINNHTATGNIPAASPEQRIEATGQFYTENGVRKFNVESWALSDAIETSVMGTLQREGEQLVLLSAEGERYTIADLPADVPLDTVLPDEQLLVNGVLEGENLFWTSIQYFPPGSNFGSGGGGGGGTGFYQLNLSGTPVPFPTPLPQDNSTTQNYIVQDGDTCATIAEQFGVSIQSLIAQNQLSQDCLIAVGQSLKIAGTTAETADVTYTVQENDTLASIALNFGITVEELKEANGIVDDIVYLDQQLFIPGQQAGDPLVGRRFEKQRGMLGITIYQQADGSSREEFTFVINNKDGFLYALLEDVSLEALRPYHNRPLDIWGTVESVDESGTAVIAVEKYEAPYPGLGFQILQGTQANIEIAGAPVTLFTTEEGQSYVQMTRDGLLDMSIIGNPGDKIYAEVLIIPDEVFGGYAVMRPFSMGLAVNPKSGEPMTPEITAHEPSVLDGTFDPQSYVPPDATIETVELVYYIPDPRYGSRDAGPSSGYIQPAWRFSGHYSNGDVFEILVQALKQEYLSPEQAPHTPPG
jgi:LysM repeat protein